MKMRDVLKNSEMKPEFKAQGIQSAAKELNILNLSEEERRQYERHIGDVRDAQSNLISSYSEGETKGKAEGEAEERKRVVTTMHRAGLTVDQINQFTGLLKTQVEEILLPDFPLK